MSFGVLMYSPSEHIEECKSTEQNVADVPSGDLVSRQEAIEAVMAEGRNVHASEYANAERIIHEADAVEALAMLPSADRPKGEWLDVEHEPYCECSVCGAYIENLDDDFAFCPRCGADMRPEK